MVRDMAAIMMAIAAIIIAAVAMIIIMTIIIIAHDTGVTEAIAATAMAGVSAPTAMMATVAMTTTVVIAGSGFGAAIRFEGQARSA